MLPICMIVGCSTKTRSAAEPVEALRVLVACHPDAMGVSSSRGWKPYAYWGGSSAIEGAYAMGTLCVCSVGRASASMTMLRDEAYLAARHVTDDIRGVRIHDAFDGSRYEQPLNYIMTVAMGLGPRYGPLGLALGGRTSASRARRRPQPADEPRTLGRSPKSRHEPDPFRFRKRDLRGQRVAIRTPPTARGFLRPRPCCGYRSCHTFDDLRRSQRGRWGGASRSGLLSTMKVDRAVAEIRYDYMHGPRVRNNSEPPSPFCLKPNDATISEIRMTPITSLCWGQRRLNEAGRGAGENASAYPRGRAR